jgi:hypothetical protein
MKGILHPNGGSVVRIAIELLSFSARLIVALGMVNDVVAHANWAEGISRCYERRLQRRPEAKNQQMTRDAPTHSPESR